MVSSGCGNKGFDRVPLAGQVKQDGVPVPLADLLFVSRPGQEIRERPQTGTRIVDGKFSIPREYGPLPGPQLAKILLLREIEQKADPAADEPEARMSVKELGYATVEIDIPQEGSDSIVIEFRKEDLSKGGEGI